MDISIYSLITSILFFSISIFICERLRRKNAFILHYNINAFLCLIGISVFRLCIPLEIARTNIVSSHTILPAIQEFFRIKIPVFSYSISIATLCLLISLIGSLICFVRLIIRIMRDRKVLKLLTSSGVNNDQINLAMKRIIGKSKRNIRIIISKKITTPLVTGLFIPKILLPTLVNEMNEEEVHNILTHEWNHILNRDLFVKLSVELLICLMWWNPIVYILKNNLEQTLEIRCDLSVTKEMNQKEKFNYLNVLLLISKSLIKTDNECSTSLLGSNFGYAKTDNNFSIKQRFEIVSKFRPVNPIKPILIVSLMLLLLGASYLVVFQPATYPPTQDINGAYVITPDNSYILVKKDGTYWLTHEKFMMEISEEKQSQNLLPKIYE